MLSYTHFFLQGDGENTPFEVSCNRGRLYTGPSGLQILATFDDTAADAKIDVLGG